MLITRQTKQKHPEYRHFTITVSAEDAAAPVKEFALTVEDGVTLVLTMGQYRPDDEHPLYGPAEPFDLYLMYARLYKEDDSLPDAQKPGWFTYLTHDRLTFVPA